MNAYDHFLPIKKKQNRYAILNECWHLVKENVLSVADIDTVMSQGLGPRYAFMGPLETAHLNAEGNRGV